MKQTNEKAAEALADPVKYPNLFPDFDVSLQVEEMFLKARENFVPANLYSSAKNDLDLNLIEIVKMQLLQKQEQGQDQDRDESDIITETPATNDHVEETALPRPPESISKHHPEGHESPAKCESNPSFPVGSPAKVDPASHPALEEAGDEQEVPAPATTENEDLDDLLEEDTFAPGKATVERYYVCCFWLTILRQIY